VLANPWIGGYQDANQQGYYSYSKQVNSSNIPGTRSGATGWYDSTRKELWLLGGLGYGASSENYGVSLLLFHLIQLFILIIGFFFFFH